MSCGVTDPRGDVVPQVPFVESPNFTRLGTREIDVVVIHTMEADGLPGTAESCAHWFARESTGVSAHYCVDADTIVQCVREEDIAWHARGANATSIGIELAGYAGQGPKGWDDGYSWAVLERAAALTGDICARHRIPIRWLLATGLRKHLAGITGHAEVSKAFARSDHRDPGPDFPVERFLRLVRVRTGDLGREHAATPSVTEPRSAR